MAARGEYGDQERILWRHQFPGQTEVAVTASDLQSLAPGVQVCDAIVDSFGVILQKESMTGQKRKIKFVPVLQMLQMKMNKSACLTSLSKMDLFDTSANSCVLFPVHVGNNSGGGHWFLVTYTPSSSPSLLQVFNSLPIYQETESGRAVELIRNTLVDLHAAMYKPRGEDWYRALEPPLVKHVKSPQQADGSQDCGIYTIFCMLHCAHGNPEEEPKFNDSPSSLLKMRRDIERIVHRGYIEN